jgi:hypothetical protein
MERRGLHWLSKLGLESKFCQYLVRQAMVTIPTCQYTVPQSMLMFSHMLADINWCAYRRALCPRNKCYYLIEALLTCSKLLLDAEDSRTQGPTYRHQCRRLQRILIRPTGSCSSRFCSVNASGCLCICSRARCPRCRPRQTPPLWQRPPFCLKKKGHRGHMPAQGTRPGRPSTPVIKGKSMDSTSTTGLLLLQL